MAQCDNAFCSSETVESESIALAGRTFCCVACADAWHAQNEALADAASSFSQHKRARTPTRMTAAARRLGAYPDETALR
jgi:hypothetical protein